jgi:hypothetical protein
VPIFGCEKECMVARVCGFKDEPSPSAPVSSVVVRFLPLRFASTSVHWSAKPFVTHLPQGRAKTTRQ